ncbi:hypothetical protein BJY04DRAFT_216317 [Aspergillus karnatakaensis]|uniref:uncharacterized protein n=1 Tax=Aspergillus karnatakaensis TaxID=1810916 RepID=UPI003CCD2781
MRSPDSPGTPPKAATFPYYATDPEHYTSFLQNYYAFKISTNPSTLGHVPKSLVQEFNYENSPWIINHDSQELILTLTHPTTNPTNTINKNEHPKTPPLQPESTSDSNKLTTLLSTSLLHLSQTSTHPLLTTLKHTWRNESFPITSPTGIPLLTIERSATALFGLLTTGVQLLCYVSSPNSTPNDLKLWIGRRSHSKQTYPGMLDTTAAGGLEAGLAPLEGIVREAVEEASLPETLVRNRIKNVGVLSYYHVTEPGPDSALDGVGLLQPEREVVYEMELDSRSRSRSGSQGGTGTGVVPVPGDSEVEEFYLWGVEEVKRALGRGEFKLNSAVVVVDFLLRHGVDMGLDGEGEYEEIVRRLHRRLDV